MKLLGGEDKQQAAKSQRSGPTGVDTLIGNRTEIRGDVVFAGGLHVDGRIIGRVMADAEAAAFLSVSEDGYIEGDISVPNVVVNGTISGNLHASEKVTLAARARVSGNLYYKSLEIQPGAQVNGQLAHDVAALPSPESGRRSESNVIDVRDVRHSKIMS